MPESQIFGGIQTPSFYRELSKQSIKFKCNNFAKMSQHIISLHWQIATALPNSILIELVCRDRTDMQCRV